MIKVSKLVLIAAVTVMGVASPALAQRSEQRAPAAARYNRAYAYVAPYSANYRRIALSSDSPALCGGGSLGANQLMHDDTGQ